MNDFRFAVGDAVQLRGVPGYKGVVLYRVFYPDDTNPLTCRGYGVTYPVRDDLGNIGVGRHVVWELEIEPYTEEAAQP